jgi:hypothetical protein
MKIRISELRKLIRQVLLETGAIGIKPGEPPDIKGFYPYDLERGVDIQGFWYKSPGRSPGSDGDPGRPADAEEYIGFKTKGVRPDDAASEMAPKQVAGPAAQGI